MHPICWGRGCRGWRGGLTPSLSSGRDRPVSRGGGAQGVMGVVIGRRQGERGGWALLVEGWHVEGEHGLVCGWRGAE